MARGIRDEQPDVTITGATVKRTSEKAILIVTKDAEEIWLPRSQLREGSEDLKAGKDVVSVTMTAWIAGEKNLSSDEDDTGGDGG
jgi:hypothetical protein